MPASFQEILNSKIVKFTVGEIEGRPTEIYVHEKAIAQLSKPLSVLLNDSASEPRRGTTWKDVRKDTFERLVQFAYTGDYSIPKAEKRAAGVKKDTQHTNGTGHMNNGSNAPEGIKRRNTISQDDDILTNGVHHKSGSTASDASNDAQRRVENHRPSISEQLNKDFEGNAVQPVTSNKKNKKKKASVAAKSHPQETEPQVTLESVKEQSTDSKFAVPEPTESGDSEQETELLPANGKHSEEEMTMVLNGDFLTLSYPLLASRDNYTNTCEPSADFEKDRSYSNVFLCHASLYTLAETYLVASLKALSLYKLHKTLCIFQLTNQNTADITDLAKYVYATSEKGSDVEVGGLKGLVCGYMAIHAKELSEDATFMNLLAGGGQIVRDFVKLQLQTK